MGLSMTMLNQDVITSLALKHFPDVVQMAGKSSFENVLEEMSLNDIGNIDLKSPEGGYNYDVTSVVSLLISICQLIISLIEISRNNSGSEDNLSTKEIRIILEDRIEKFDKPLPPFDENALIDSIIEKINEE